MLQQTFSIIKQNVGITVECQKDHQGGGCFTHLIQGWPFYIVNVTGNVFELQVYSQYLYLNQTVKTNKNRPTVDYAKHLGPRLQSVNMQTNEIMLKLNFKLT